MEWTWFFAGPRSKCQCSPCRKYTTPPGEQDTFIPILVGFLMGCFFAGMGVVVGIGFSSGASYTFFDVRSSDLPVLLQFLTVVFFPLTCIPCRQASRSQ